MAAGAANTELFGAKLTNSISGASNQRKREGEWCFSRLDIVLVTGEDLPEIYGRFFPGTLMVSLIIS